MYRPPAPPKLARRGDALSARLRTLRSPGYGYPVGPREELEAPDVHAQGQLAAVEAQDALVDVPHP